MTNLFNQNQTENTLEKLEGNSEQKEQFDKNSKEFQDKYEQKLKNILPEEIVKKMSGSFEFSGNLKNSLKILEEKGLSKNSLDSIKNFLNNNTPISNENLKNISEELKNSENEKNIDLELGSTIGKATKKAESTENDDLFEKVMKAREIQKSGNLEEKKQILEKLNNLISEENHQITEINQAQEPKKDNPKQNNNGTISVEDANIGNDKGIFEEGVLTGNLFSKDSVEYNDYGNEPQIQQKENIFQKGADFLKGNNEKSPEEKTDFSEKNGTFYPILENLKNSGEIKNENFESINKELASKSGTEKQDLFLKTINNLPNSENKNNILSKFKNNEKITEENFEKTSFSNDFKGKINLDKSIGGLELMLAENYIYLSNKENSQDKNKEKSLEMTMEISKSKLIDKHSSDFRKNNAELISEITSEKNLDKKYQKLKELHKESLKEDTKAGGKKALEETERKKQDLIGQYKETIQEIEKAKKSGNNEELEKLNKEKQQLEKEARETQNLIEELDKIAKETDLDIGTNSENINTKKEE